MQAGDLIFLHGTVGLDAHGRLPGDMPGWADMVGHPRYRVRGAHTPGTLIEIEAIAVAGARRTAVAATSP